MDYEYAHDLNYYWGYVIYAHSVDIHVFHSPCIVDPGLEIHGLLSMASPISRQLQTSSLQALESFFMGPTLSRPLSL